MCDPVCNYTNFLTFTVAMWFSSDRKGAEVAKTLVKAAENADQGEVWTREEATRFNLEDILKEYFTDVVEMQEDIPPPLDSILSAALHSVDWLNVADDILAE